MVKHGMQSQTLLFQWRTQNLYEREYHSQQRQKFRVHENVLYEELCDKMDDVNQ